LFKAKNNIPAYQYILDTWKIVTVKTTPIKGIQTVYLSRV